MCVCVCVCASLYTVVYIYIYVCVCVCARAGLRAYVEHTAWASVLFSFTFFKASLKKARENTDNTQTQK